MLYAVLKTMSWLASHTPYKLLVKIGTGVGHLYWHIAKKQRIRAEETIRERMQCSARIGTSSGIFVRPFRMACKMAGPKADNSFPIR